MLYFLAIMSRMTVLRIFILCHHHCVTVEFYMIEYQIRISTLLRHLNHTVLYRTILYYTIPYCTVQCSLTHRQYIIYSTYWVTWDVLVLYYIGNIFCYHMVQYTVTRSEQHHLFAQFFTLTVM
jgi:hypothetical protein